MTQDERLEIHERVKTMIADGESKAGEEPKVKAPPQDEDLIAQELRATRLIYQCLEPMSPHARQRIIAHVMQFFDEQEQRERRDMANMFNREP